MGLTITFPRNSYVTHRILHVMQDSHDILRVKKGEMNPDDLIADVTNCYISLCMYVCMYECKTLFQHTIFVNYLHQLTSTKGVLYALNLKHIVR